MFKLRNVWHDLKGTTQFIVLSLIIFAVSIYVGMSNDKFTFFLNNQMEAMRELVGQIDQSSNPTLSMLIFIFLTMQLSQ